MSNTLFSPSDMASLMALGPEDIGHNYSVNAFDHQSPSYQSSELFKSHSLAPLPYAFNADETVTFISCPNLEHFDLPMDAPNRLSTPDPTSETLQPEEMVPTSYVSHDFGASIVTQSKIPRRWATERDWTRHRALITELYGENKLPKVMSIMESQKCFKATVKMYKTHIAKWGLDKKIKEPEMRAIVRKNKQRAEHGKRSNFRVRKRQLNFAEVVRYWERKGVTIDEVIARSTASPTPEAIECFTPVSSPIMPPEALATPEYILRIIRGYIAASFESGTWVKTDPRRSCYSIKDGSGSGYRYSLEFVNFYDLAAYLLATKTFDEMEGILSAATAMSRKILLAEDPGILRIILGRIAHMQYRNQHEIALHMLRQLSAISRELLGENHPLSLFWAWLDAMPWSQIKNIISRCFDVIADDFESIVGPMHTSTLNCRLSQIDVDINLGMLRRLLDKCEIALGSCDRRTLIFRCKLMNCTFTKGHYAAAKRMGEDLLTHVQRNQELIKSNWFKITSQRIIARCQYALGEPYIAISNLKVAIHLCMKHYGAQDGLARTWLVTLEQWYIGQGQLNEATAARDWRIKLLVSTEMG